VTEHAVIQATASVPFLDLGRVHEPLRSEILADVDELITTGAFSNGPHVKLFEQAYAAYCGRTACVGVASGLDGLRLALQALGVGQGDEVIVPAQTFVATYEAVMQVGATPVVVDVRVDDYNLDPVLAEAALTARTRCILPVDLYGQLADLQALRGVADRHGLAIVEDACQAHGARRDGIAAGALADAAAFSFYPGKNLGALGDAGAVVTDDADLAERIRMLREHGQRAKYLHEAIGWTSRLDTLQAAVLLRKLPHLDDWNAQRRRIAARYLEELEGVGDLGLPSVAPRSEPVWHLFVVVTERPDELIASLRARGVQTGRHYPEPPHLTEAYAHLGYPPGSFPVAESLAAGCVSLPIFPGMQSTEIDAVVVAVRDFFS
jgi:dTDP-3-amino-3,4,6-trideoxy-alpha-D-glucose transaminase